MSQKKKKSCFVCSQSQKGVYSYHSRVINALLALSQQKIYTTHFVTLFLCIGHSNNIQNTETLYTYCTHDTDIQAYMYVQAVCTNVYIYE